MESIFKVGDKVYDIQFGWGEVVELCSYSEYPVRVRFKEDLGEEEYTGLGYWRKYSKNPNLSFTEYTLQGFSQERPFNPQDCVGKWCQLLGGDTETILIDKIIDIQYGEFKDRDGVCWEEVKPLTEEQLQAFNITND